MGFTTIVSKVNQPRDRSLIMCDLNDFFENGGGDKSKKC